MPSGRNADQPIKIVYLTQPKILIMNTILKLKLKSNLNIIGYILIKLILILKQNLYNLNFKLNIKLNLKQKLNLNIIGYKLITLI